MGFVVECFNDALTASNLLNLQQNQRELAVKYGATIQYFTHEVEGYKRITKRSDNIHVAEFEDIPIETLYKYIQEICRCKYYKIDCIYNDEIPFGMLYASPRYLKRLDKHMASSMKKKLNNEKNAEVIQIKNIINNKFTLSCGGENNCS